MYNHAPDRYVCPFCSLIQGIRDERIYSVHSDIVYHDEVVAAFISSHQWPNNPGNVIVIPIAHYENLYNLPVECAVDIHRVVKSIALAMKAVYQCDGISIRQHNEPAGNQDVWHYHVHVTPRYNNDEFYTSMMHRALMPVEERAKHAEKLRDYLLNTPTQF
jgi:histidine triad (HIT) family protein